jgi:hypothetical protein
MHTRGGRSWSVRTGEADDLAALLAVRELADLPYYDQSIPEPLEPTPTIERLFTSQEVRRAAAGPWGALWRIAVAGRAAQGREAIVQPDPPLYGLSSLWMADPPKFGSLASTPELRQIMVSTHVAIRSWLAGLSRPQPPSGNWALDLIAQADHAKGSPIPDVTLHLETLPIRGTRHWTLTEDPDRKRLHALVSADLVTDPERHFGWLLEALQRIG